jgi:hypothetical protein
MEHGLILQGGLGFLSTYLSGRCKYPLMQPQLDKSPGRTGDRAILVVRKYFRIRARAIRAGPDVDISFQINAGYESDKKLFSYTLRRTINIGLDSCWALNFKDRLSTEKGAQRRPTEEQPDIRWNGPGPKLMGSALYPVGIRAPHSLLCRHLFSEPFQPYLLVPGGRTGEAQE